MPAGDGRARAWAAVGTALVALSMVWPLSLALATGARLAGDSPLWSGVVYLAASRVCHQRPERSFHTEGVAWPVCARCAGLYLAGPIGAVAAWSRRARPALSSSASRWRLALSAMPTAATIVVEWTGIAPVSNLARAIAAVPLGIFVAWTVIDVLPVRRPNQVH